MEDRNTYFLMKFWATIINSCFISYKLLDGKNDINSFFLFSEFCIQFEKIFSLFQCVKMLNYMAQNRKLLLYQEKKVQYILQTIYYLIMNSN